MPDDGRWNRSYLWLCGGVALLGAGLLVYAFTWAFTWDESYHLLAAQLIGGGKKPYIDFCFPQSPLNAYWNAGWMRLLGESWRVPHGFATLFTIAAVLLATDFVFVRFPVPNWRLSAAIAVLLMTGLNAKVFLYGPLAQPYGICLFALVAAFRCATHAVERRGALWAAGAGVFAGAAAASSLLTAAAAPVLAIWMLVYHRAGSRWAKLVAYCIGSAIPFAPVFRLFWLGPRQTWFNLAQYHLLYRRLYWPETTQHDLEVLTSWIDSGQALAIGLLTAFGLYYVVRRANWPRPLTAELYLCGWLSAALCAESGRAHPTFARYFLLAVPFLAILAAVGLYAAASRLLDDPGRPWRAVLLVFFVFALGLGRSIYDHANGMGSWRPYEAQARKVEEVTPRGAWLYADEPIYFLTHRTPPPGYELSYTHRLDLPPAEAALLHIVSGAEVKRQVNAGMFATAYTCDTENEIAEYGLNELYRQHVVIEECSIFWDLKKK